MKIQRMKRSILLLTLFLSSCLFSTNNTSTKNTSRSTDEELIGKIISVKDGDSLELLDADNNIHQIRLAHVDCPENKQDFGKRSKIFTANFCFGKEVTVLPTDTDRYGRTVGVVFVGREELNLAIIKAGMGWHFKKYSKDDDYDRAEKWARTKKVGLWSQPNPVAPWDYRKRG